MRVLMTILIFACVFSLTSAITGIQSFSADSRNGTVVTYWNGYWRLLALAHAGFFAAAFYGIYRRHAITWRLGLAFIVLNSASFAFQAWRSLGTQPHGWVGALAATGGAAVVALFWGSWWWRQKSYFLGGGDE